MSSEQLSKWVSKKTAIMALFMVLIIAAISILGGYFYRQQQVSASNSSALTATGTIEARTVMASFKVPGKIAAIMVEEGSLVEKGQELAVLDSRELEAKAAQAQGAYEAAQGLAGQAADGIPLTAQSVDAAIKQAQALVAQAEAGLTNAKQKYDRAKALYEGGAVAASVYDEATNNLAAAQSQYDAAQGKLNEAQAALTKVKISAAQYDAALGQSKQAQGAVQEAQAYLENAHLLAPLSGYVTARMLEEGEMLNAGTPVLEITDLKHTYVKVFVDESKIGRVHLNQSAAIKVPAYPDKVFNGTIVWISDAGQFAVHKAINEQYEHDIRSFEIKIDVPNDSLELKTGMTAIVTIDDGETV